MVTLLLGPIQRQAAALACWGLWASSVFPHLEASFPGCSLQGPRQRVCFGSA